MESTGSIKANVQFLSFKMDKIEFSATQTLEALATQDLSDFETGYSFAFRNALRFVGQPQVLYVTGIQVGVIVKSKKSGQELGKGSFIITGLFSSDGVMDKNLEEKIIKYQCPAILLPYLRATISTVLSNAGFGTTPMPLINVNEAAKSANVTIEERQLK